MNLALFFTQGVSLKTWSTVGMLDRELALYRQLQARGVGIEFVTYGDQQDLAFASQIPGLRIRANTSNLNLSAYERKLLSEPVQADMVKSNQMAGADIAMGVARKTAAKFVARCGYLLSEFQERRYGERSREAKQARKLEEKVFSGADWITLTTAKMAEAVVQRYKVHPEKIGIIPNYVETDRFYPISEHQPTQKLRIGFVGRLDTQKNLRNLIAALVDIDVEVWLIGYGPLKEELERFAEGAVAQFKFFGNIPNHDLPRMLNQCDIFVMPSLYEGHPKALLEAMACGLPALGTRVPGIQEIITDGENGLLSEIGAVSLREAIQRLLDDAELRARLGKAGREYVQTHFALERVVDLEMDLLNRLAG
ncbi:MAG: glycosyltransferase family 4 protein [Anaerolineales bacterium]|nr:glycosyltransferase family 4 protein [Anaerolineales bacterium]